MEFDALSDFDRDVRRIGDDVIDRGTFLRLRDQRVGVVNEAPPLHEQFFGRHIRRGITAAI